MTEVEQQAPAPTTEAPAKEEVVEEKKVEAEAENKARDCEICPGEKVFVSPATQVFHHEFICLLFLTWAGEYGKIGHFLVQVLR